METIETLKIVLVALLCVPAVWVSIHFLGKLYNEFAKKPKPKETRQEGLSIDRRRR